MVSIIILSYNTEKLLRACLESIDKNLKGIDFEVIVVDNASADESTEMVRNNFKDVILVENKKNEGFSKGNNIGAKKAQGDYLVFLNSDTELYDNGLMGMVEFLETHETVGILGGRLKNVDKSLQKSAGTFYTLFNVFLMLFGVEKIGMLKKSPSFLKQVDWVSGAFMMIPRRLFEKLKGFDEHFFMYMEDMEICFRAKKLGFSTYFYPKATVLHKGLGSSDRTFAIIHIYKGLLYFYEKHKPSWQYKIVKFILTIKAFTAISLGFLTRNTYLRNTYKKALNYNA